LPVAVITGANSGMGVDFAVKLASSYRVYAGVRNPSEARNKDLVGAAEEAGVTSNLKIVDLDVNSDDSVKKTFEEIFAEIGAPVDLLINNAGYALSGPTECVSMEAIKKQFEVNFFGAVRCQQAVLPGMRKARKGRIVNISTIGVVGPPLMDFYAASKSALDGLMRAQVIPLKALGIYVTNVNPGLVATNFGSRVEIDDNLPEDYMQIRKSMDHKWGTLQQSDEFVQLVIDNVLDAKEPPSQFYSNPSTSKFGLGTYADMTGAAHQEVIKSEFFGGGVPAVPVTDPSE